MIEGVYGKNDPENEDTGEPTARDENPDNVHPDHEKGVGEMMEDDRQKKAAAQKMGGMGREEVPKEDPRNVKGVAHTESDSDQVPS